MQAIWQGTIIAESNETIIVEGNHYFPPNSLNEEYLKETDSHSTCFWKGTASYYTIKVGDQENVDAAWYYPEPLEKAQNIKNYVAFWKGVEIV